MENMNSPRVSGRLLISGTPLIIMPLLAEKIGLNEAIILQQVHYWISNPLNQNIKDERVWVYNTINEWGKQFPFWSRDTVKVTILSLQNKKLLISKLFNKTKADRTKWYTIDYEVLKCLDIGTLAEIPPMIGGNPANDWRKSRQCTNTEITTKITTDIKKNNKKSFDAEFEEFWQLYKKKVDRHKCEKIYKTLLAAEGISLHTDIINSLTGQLREREVNDELGEWSPLQKNPSTWLNGRCWGNEFKTEGEIREENRRNVSKLIGKGRPTKADQQHNVLAQFREAAELRLEAIAREEEAERGEETGGRSSTYCH